MQFPHSKQYQMVVLKWLPCLSHLGHQDFPEEEELGDVQLQAVLLPIWDAGAVL